MTPVKGIVFDKDGTLFDFANTWETCAQDFIGRLAKDESHAIQLGDSIGFDVAKNCFNPDSVAIAGTTGEVVSALAPRLPGVSWNDLFDTLNNAAAQAEQVEATPLRPFLDGLRDRGVRLGVATNDTEISARAHLDAAGITQSLDFIAGFDSGFGAKPEPGPLLAFAEAMTLAPQDVLMVGDSLHDLLAARAAGMRAVGVLTGLAETATLAPHAEVVLPDIGHLTDWLEQQNLLLS